MAQYIFLNRTPGMAWDQNRPEGIRPELFTEPLARVGASPTAETRLGLHFVLSVLDGSLDTLASTLKALIQTAEATNTPTLFVIDGQNWWGNRPDLWNWWDTARPGYNPKNAENVEWTGPGTEHAVKICWRNWGRQIRVLPQPNLASLRYRAAVRGNLRTLLPLIRDAAKRRPDLFPGVKLGWEASVGINFFHYPNGNDLLDRPEKDDPTTGLDLKQGFSGGLPPLGYAARARLRPQASGPITLADIEQIVSDYLAFLVSQAREAGFRREQVFTHAGGQYAPYEKHVSHRIAIHKDAVPGWSLYFTDPDKAGDLGKSLQLAKREDWCAAEWLTGGQTAEGWANAIRRTLDYRHCRFLALYNYEGILNNAPALAGIKNALSSEIK